jgi:adenylate cyclase
LEKLIEEEKTNVTKINENYENIFYDVASSLGLVLPPPDYDGVFRRYIPLRRFECNRQFGSKFRIAILNKYYELKNTVSLSVKETFQKLGNKSIPQYDKQSVLINFYGPSGTFPHYQLIDILDDKDL